MELHVLDLEFAVCRVTDPGQIDLTRDFFFLAKTDEECSLVCPVGALPRGAVDPDTGWRAMRVVGTLDFGLVGVLAGLSGLLAAEGIPIFAVSTFRTDYMLVKAADLGRAVDALRRGGHTVE